MIRRSTIAPLLLWLILVSCQPEPTGPVESQRMPAVLASLRMPISALNSDTILVNGTRKSTDVLTVELPVFVRVSHFPTPSAPIDVQYSFAGPDGRSTGDEGGLKDDGQYPDMKSNDSVFSTIAAFHFVRTTIGTFSLSTVAVSSGGMISGSLMAGIQVVRLNQPPVLSDLVADSSVSLSGPTQLIDLRVRATDPDGKSDIQRVFFDSFRPDGTPANGNPFSLYDDGNSSNISNDLVAGDGIYSLRIQFAGATLGFWRFEFRAIDHSSDSSNSIIHRIQVIP